MTIIRNPSSAGLSDPSIVRQTEASLAQSSLIARGKPAVVNNGLVLPSTTLTTTSNTVVATTSQNNQSADTVTIYESSGNVYVSSIDQIVNKTTINNPVAGVGKIIAGDNITITSSNGDGTGNVTINSTGGGSGTPGGSNTQIQFNDAGSFGGNSSFTFNKTTGIFTSPFVAGNGNGLSNIQGANVSGAVGLATYATTANAVAGGNVSGTVANANTSLNIANGTSNINIPTVNGNIVATVGGSNVWTFDTTGNLTLPGGTILLGDGSGIQYPTSTGYEWDLHSSDGNVYIGSVEDMAYIDTYSPNIGVRLRSNENDWIFGPDGNVSVPGGIIGSGNLKLSPDSTNVGAYLDIFLTSGPDVHLVASQSANLILGKDDQSNVMTSWDGNVYVQSWDVNTNTQGGVWTFGGDGNLTTPGVSGNITGANVIEANTFAIAGGTTLNQVEGPNTVGFYNSSANTQFLFELGSSNVWGFEGNTGGTIFPQLSVQRGDNPSGTITGQTLLFNDSTQEAIISTPDGTSFINSSQRLVINPGAGYANTAGEGGDIYLWAGRGGNASGTGGDIKIRGGQGGANTSGGSGGDGGYIRIEAGDASNAGTSGYTYIRGGNSATAQGGYVEIYGGQGATIGGSANLKGGYGTATGGNVNVWGGASGNGQVNEGHVNIQTGGNTWTFDPTGNLTAPGGAYFAGQSLFVGEGSDIQGFISETLVIYHEGLQYVQAALVNSADTGSSDWVAYGHNGNDAGGWVDMGFTGISYNDPNFTITGPGDGYVFVEGFADNQTGGSLILATGGQGTTKDIIFATNGFALENEFGRISNANNAFELNSNANITGANVISANYIGAGNIILSEGGTLTNNIPPATFDILYQYDDLVWSGNTLTFTNASSTYMLGVLALMQVGDTITLGGTPTTVTGAYTGGGAGTFNVSGTGVGQQIGQFTLPNRLTSVNGIKLTTNSKNYLFTEVGVTQSPVLTVATLPSGQFAVAGFRAFVSDANLAPVGNFGEIVGSGGSNTVCVWCDGTNWRIG